MEGKPAGSAGRRGVMAEFLTWLGQTWDPIVLMALEAAPLTRARLWERLRSRVSDDPIPGSLPRLSESVLEESLAALCKHDLVRPAGDWDPESPGASYALTPTGADLAADLRFALQFVDRIRKHLSSTLGGGDTGTP